MPSAETDRPRTLLLLVDAQVDFIHQDGALCVPGAIQDTRRTVEWLLTHVGEVSQVAASLDSHVPLQIFYPTWWHDDQGHLPEPYTVISAKDVDGKVWGPAFERQWSRDYVHRLEDQAKKQLMIWPYHTMLGTPGHALDPSLSQAIAFHSAARRAQPKYLIKGMIAKTEYYSLLEPEVKVPEDPQGDVNRPFLEWLIAFDRVYVAGQAKSHCVLETLASVARHVAEAPDAMRKVRLLEDCTSSVVHPEIDFEAMALEALNATRSPRASAGGIFRTAGMKPDVRP